MARKMLLIQTWIMILAACKTTSGGSDLSDDEHIPPTVDLDEKFAQSLAEDLKKAEDHTNGLRESRSSIAEAGDVGERNDALLLHLQMISEVIDNLRNVVLRMSEKLKNPVSAQLYVRVNGDLFVAQQRSLDDLAAPKGLLERLKETSSSYTLMVQAADARRQTLKKQILAQIDEAVMLLDQVNRVFTGWVEGENLTGRYHISGSPTSVADLQHIGSSVRGTMQSEYGNGRYWKISVDLKRVHNRRFEGNMDQTNPLDGCTTRFYATFSADRPATIRVDLRGTDGSCGWSKSFTGAYDFVRIQTP